MSFFTCLPQKTSWKFFRVHLSVSSCLQQSSHLDTLGIPPWELWWTVIHLCSRSHKAVCTTGETLLNTSLSPQSLLDVRQTPFKWVRGKSMHLRNVWPALSVSFHFYTWPPYPISRHPLCQVPRQHCQQVHPKVPRSGCTPTQQGVLLPADASTMTFEGSILPRVARGCGLWQPLTEKAFCFLNQKAYGLLGGLSGTARVKPLQWKLGPHYPSLLPGLFPLS